MINAIKKMKVREIREEYEKGDINVVRFVTPRSETHIHSPSKKKDHIGNRTVSTVSKEEVIWELDEDEKLQFLKGNRGTSDLLVKNVKCEVEEI